jgi:hypothetical protein
MNTTLPALDWAINLLIVQALMGAFDTLYHHELTQGLPHSPRARRAVHPRHPRRAVRRAVCVDG